MNHAFLLSIAVCGLSLARPAAAQTTPASANQAPMPVQLNCRAFSGHVKSTTGTPLVGATVLIKGTYVARTTNDEGYFTFELPAVPTTAPYLMVSSAGFAPQSFLITGCAPLEIELQILEGTRIKQRGKHKGFIKKVGQE